jgi:hypothetical protein
MEKRKFRKVYFVCVNNHVFDSDYDMVNAYRTLDYAKTIAAQSQRNQMEKEKMEWNKNDKGKKLRFQAEGFYLVHESLFNEILKKYCEGN